MLLGFSVGWLSIEVNPEVTAAEMHTRGMQLTFLNRKLNQIAMLTHSVFVFQKNGQALE